MSARLALLGRIAAESRESPTVRIGVVAIAAIAWLYLLLVARDALPPARERLAQLEDRVQTAQAEERDRGWPGREAAARGELNALRAMLWQSPTSSLAEATFRDWIQSTAQAAGLKVRTLAVQSAEGATAAAHQAASAASAPLPDDVQPVRAHLTVDFDRNAWAAFLLKLATNAHVVGVDRVVVHNATNPGAVSELDLEALFLLGGPGS
jgi:hypothetical protein